MGESTNRLIISTDGGARGNPGPAGIGVVVKQRDGAEIKRYSEYIGETTNNQAEYRAVLKGLELAQSLGVAEIEVRVDSELVVKQLRGEYKVKSKELAPLFVKAWNLARSFKKAEFAHVPREHNKLADQLVNKAIDDTIQL